MNRRNLLLAGGGAAAIFAGTASMFNLFTSRKALAASGEFEIARTEAEWRAVLSPAQYEVLRDHGTERPFTSALNDEKRKGVFHCAGCDLPVYSSEVKFDSGTGWPSFWESIPDAIGTTVDRSYFMVRTECHCRRCGGHFGHIFDDGPPPTGKRHCINGLSLAFKPATA